MAELKSKSAGELRMPAAPEGAAAGGAWEIIATAPMHTSAKIRIPAK